MKQVFSTLTMALLCLCSTAQPGALHGGFNSNGHVIHSLHADNDHGDAIATHSDGRVIVAAYNTDKWFTLLRYMPDGSLDGSFQKAGPSTAVIGGVVPRCGEYGAGGLPLALMRAEVCGVVEEIDKAGKINRLVNYAVHFDV